MAESYLLVSDVDDTLLGDDAALERFAEWYDENASRVKLVYASGRFVDSLLDSLRATNLPPPEAFVGGVGTEIIQHPTGDMFCGWLDRLEDDWDPEKVRQIMAREPGAEYQPIELQSHYKVSYFLHSASREQLDEISQKLANGGIRADLIYSSDRDLDVVPANVNKGTAAAFLAKRWEYSPDNVIVSGNSANDADLFKQGFLGVVVANAHDELKTLAGPRVYVAGQPRAAGVLEGVEHWMRVAQGATP
ncbi:MAG: HAD-IIB family hydrolase [Pirellulales bacterium]